MINYWTAQTKLILVGVLLLSLLLFVFFITFSLNDTSSLVFYINIVAFLGMLIISCLVIRAIYKDTKNQKQIEALSKEIEVVNMRVHVMEQSKTDFMSIASHQLRTPLTVIKGYASMILEGTFGQLREGPRMAMTNMYQASERIIALVEDLLTVSRLEQGRLRLDFKTVDLIAFVQNVLIKEGKQIRSTGLNLSFAVDEKNELFVSIDERKFEQAIKHVLDNAIKYTTTPGSIHVSVSRDPMSQKAHLMILDTGVGMLASQIDSLFERYDLKVATAEAKIPMPIEKVAEGTDIKESGEVEAPKIFYKKTVGIGLYVTKEIIYAHKGRVIAKSKGKNMGTTIIIELPQVQ